ncbi:MAG: AraC family ligand binding domain-containing protein, partial [Clostridia bacterium]|nr:AraC family ligand binding domain-containing protein [Clostridia bacterium]
MEAKKEALRKSGGMEQSMDCLIQLRLPANKSGNNTTHLHYHEYIEFLYGLSGEARVWIGSKSYSLAEGDLLIINAGEPHDVTPGAREASYYVIKFLPKLLYAQGQSLSVIRYLLPLWQKQVGFRPALRKADLQDSGIGELVARIRREWEARSPGYELIVHANIMQIFVWVLRHCCTDLETAARVPAPLQKALQVALEETPRHLDDWT